MDANVEGILADFQNEDQNDDTVVIPEQPVDPTLFEERLMPRSVWSLEQILNDDALASAYLP